MRTGRVGDSVHLEYKETREIEQAVISICNRLEIDESDIKQKDVPLIEQMYQDVYGLLSEIIMEKLQEIIAGELDPEDVLETRTLEAIKARWHKETPAATGAQ